MPETFGALRNSKLFGTAFTQNKTEFVKYKLFATVVSSATEATVYNPVALEYAGKILSLQLIAPGIDHWGSVEQTITTTGTEETVSFLDRVKMLLQLQERLWREVTELQPLVEQEISITPIIKARPRVSPAGTDKSPDPQKFPAAYVSDSEVSALFLEGGEFESWA